MPPTEDRDWKESLGEFAADKLNDEDFERLLVIVWGKIAAAEARGYARGADDVVGALEANRWDAIEAMNWLHEHGFKSIARALKATIHINPKHD